MLAKAAAGELIIMGPWGVYTTVGGKLYPKAGSACLMAAGVAMLWKVVEVEKGEGDAM